MAITDSAGTTISIHSLRMEGDGYYIVLSDRSRGISIHSLRMEGDDCRRKSLPIIWHFNPLPPHGGRQRLTRNATNTANFNPLPPHGGRPHKCSLQFSIENISIHSLRMEGDGYPLSSERERLNFNPLPPHGGRLRQCWLSTTGELFQSTPSAWRETDCRRKSLPIIWHFNPLPPHGGRQQTGKESH